MAMKAGAGRRMSGSSMLYTSPPHWTPYQGLGYTNICSGRMQLLFLGLHHIGIASQWDTHGTAREAHPLYAVNHEP